MVLQCAAVISLFVFTLIPTLLAEQYQTVQRVYPCSSRIFCQGPILHAVNRLEIFKDSKEYVDMPLKKSEEETLQDFEDAFPDESSITKEELQTFLHTHFHNAGSELVSHAPSDWSLPVESFDLIQETEYKKWAVALHTKWNTLCKKINPNISHDDEKTSLIHLPFEFIVPGGRFREIYYWDSYWVIRALLQSGMLNTSRSMIKNYLALVHNYGFVPNGGRKYYLKRSQPPMLIPMVYEYYQTTKDHQFVASNLVYLEKEMEFWIQNRSLNIMVNNAEHRVYHYNTRTNTPRPESYKVDVDDAINLPEEDKANLYSNIASAAETGWDFSSRWMADSGTFRLLKTRLILPVDLNAFICNNFRMLSELSNIANQTSKVESYKAMHETCVETIMALFYNETFGVWFDYHLDTQKHNTAFYPSNIVPLFTKTYKFENNDAAFEKIFDYLKMSKSLNYANGIPTSFKPTGQQWDWPNAWAPLVHMTVLGLDETTDERLKLVAYYLAEHWIRLNHGIFIETKHMYEKYDIVTGQIANGGEYEVQEGFGWTNAVIIELLLRYGDKLSLSKNLSNNSVIDDVMRHDELHFQRRKFSVAANQLKPVRARR